MLNRIFAVMAVIVAAFSFTATAEARMQPELSSCEVSFKVAVADLLSGYPNAYLARNMTPEQAAIFWQRVLVFSRHRAPVDFSGRVLWQMTVAEGEVPDRIAIYDKSNNPNSLVMADQDGCLVFEALIVTSILDMMIKPKVPPLMPPHQQEV